MPNKEQQTMMKIPSKGVTTISKKSPKRWRLKERTVIEYRLYNKEEINKMVKEDQLPQPLASETKNYWSKLPKNNNLGKNI